MAKISGFKEAEHRAVDGKLFVVEAVIKMFTSFKLDSAGRTCLSILRHCGRFKVSRTVYPPLHHAAVLQAPREHRSNQTRVFTLPC